MAEHPLASGASTAIAASPVATAATGATPAGTPGSPLPAAGIEARFAVDYAGFRLDVDLRLPGRGVT
nr:molybdenum ABC transporter ATP-binding protein [Thauera phenylacetica]